MMGEGCVRKNTGTETKRLSAFAYILWLFPVYDFCGNSYSRRLRSVASVCSFSWFLKIVKILNVSCVYMNYLSFRNYFYFTADVMHLVDAREPRFIYIYFDSSNVSMCGLKRNWTWYDWKLSMKTVCTAYLSNACISKVQK